MSMHEKIAQKTISGRYIRTTNQEVAQTIPQFWRKFFESGGIDAIEGRLSDTIYALYTEFENDGKSNIGEYTFLIGAEVDTTAAAQDGHKVVTIPEGDYSTFSVDKEKPEKVFDTWQMIWGRDDLDRSFVCDFEEYQPDGNISIKIGIR